MVITFSIESTDAQLERYRCIPFERRLLKEIYGWKGEP